MRSPALSLETCTDPVAMRGLLQTHLPLFAQGRLRIDQLSVYKARRSSSRHRNPCPITLCYELGITDVERATAGRQMLYAKVYRDGASADVFDRIDTTALTPPVFGTPLAHLAMLDMVLWAMPNDPGLPQLARLLDPLQVVPLLPASFVDGDRSTARVAVDLLRYEPERRATLRYTLDADALPPRQLYAKTFRDDRAPQLHERFAYFWQLAARDPTAPQVAEPLGYCPQTHTVWLAPVVGVPLCETLDANNAAQLMNAVARTLALVHDAPLSSPRQRSVEHWLTEARRRQKKLARADPEFAPRVAAVVDALERHAARLPAQPLSLIHGDFHPDQLWTHEARLVLFDLDELALGHPMEDLAAFLCRIDNGPWPAQLGATMREHLLRAYAAHAPARFDARHLAWQRALQQLLQATRAFVFQQPGWRAQLEARLLRAEANARAMNEECCV